MTEDEAKTKWCPFSSVSFVGGNRVNKDGEYPAGCSCIGSGCAAWRWDGPARWDTTEGRTPEEAGAKTIRHGFCGLAGKP